MDTTSASVTLQQEHEQPYVSCIKVDGLSILPPLMSDNKRAEMRYFRQLAIEREQARQLARRLMSVQTTKTETPLPHRMYLTSTPNAYMIMKSKEIGQDVRHDQDSDDSDDDDDNDKGGNFASVGSSTGTFIINNNVQQGDEATAKSESEVEDLEEEEDECSAQQNNQLKLEQQPVSARGLLDTTSLVSVKRKRPARYFDNNVDDDEGDFTVAESEEKENLSVVKTTMNISSEDDNTCTFQTSSTSLSKYISSCTPTFTPTPILNVELPCTVPVVEFVADANATVNVSSTFTINTNFAQAALSVTPPRKRGIRRSSVSKSRKSLSFTSISPTLLTPIKSGTTRVTDPDFEFILTTEIPESAANSASKSHRDEDETSCPSDSSDKENHSSEMDVKKHVRKLSYTLLTPSAALLAASGMEALPVINSATSSVVISSSAQSTPMKGDKEWERLETRTDSPEVQIAVSQLQQLNLGKGKKAHLERYLGEVEADGNKQTTTATNFEDNNKKAHHEDVISQIEIQHHKQLEQLMAAYKQQAQKIREDFEKEKQKILLELAPPPSSPTPTPSIKPPQNLNSEPSSTDQTIKLLPSTPSSSILMDTSNLRNYYITNSVDSHMRMKESHSAPVSSADIEISSMLSRTVISSEGGWMHHDPAQSPTISSRGGNVSNAVGLSKFQSKMQKINPSLLKHPGDVRSPLLKGLVFPDPLDRSSVVLKIPPQAHDPAMKLKFDKLTAGVKGYLTRRLLQTEKIQIIIQTIRDTVELLLNLYEENPPNNQGLIEIKELDQVLHHGLIQQLTGACSSFNDIFFKISIKERMAIIANDREKIRAKALRNVLSRRSGISPSKRNISSATLKSFERRQSQSKSPSKKANQIISTARFQRPSLKPMLPPLGSQTVKPNGVKSYNVSPKRRRMSFMGGGGDKHRTTRASSTKNGNVNQRGGPHSAIASNRNKNIAEGSTDTFLVPSSTSSMNQWRYSQAPTSKSVKSSNRPSMTRVSVGMSSSSTSYNRSTIRTENSITRVPWKK